MMLTSEELLAGSKLTFEIEVPEEILQPTGNGGKEFRSRKVRLRPLAVSDLQLVSRAAKESDNLMAALMVQRSLVEPELGVVEATSMHVGLMQYLLQHVNRISGITSSSEDLSSSTKDPLAKAAFILSKEFGWTPAQVNELTMGQIMLHLQMLKEKSAEQ
jgi:hypothetical protein